MTLPATDASAPATDFTRAEGQAWCACHTKPRCEKKFAALLKAERIQHYLPLVTSVRKYLRQQKTFAKPLFPGYVFARVPADRAARLYQQDLLVRVIRVDDEALLLRQLQDVQRIVASGLQATLHPLLRRGTPVRVMGGPLRGLEGVVDDPRNPQGIILSVDVLQQGLLVKIPLDDLKVLPR